MEELNSLIEKFWSGQTSPSEDMRLRDLLNQQDKQLLLDDSIEQEVNFESSREEALLERIHEKIDAQDGRGTIVRTLPGRTPWYWMAAASIVILLGIGIFGWFNGERRPEDIVRTGRADTSRLVKITTPVDSVKVVTLGDGSKVRLFGGSGITYYEPFRPGERNISLQGVAEFDVAKDSTRPFSVYTEGLVTTALGTRFIVDAKTGSGYISVRLLEGKVVLIKQGMKDVFLKPGEESRLDTRSGSMVLHSFEKGTGLNATNPGQQYADNSGRKEPLAFVQTPLSDVFAKLEKHYHVRIDSRDGKVNTTSFTGTFYESDSLGAILNMICVANKLSFEKEQDKIIIKKTED